MLKVHPNEIFFHFQDILMCTISLCQVLIAEKVNAAKADASRSSEGIIAVLYLALLEGFKTKLNT